ncbi:GNAT family N-acetyltransferase [Clostridiales bacterium FE2011]|nr:GNAT family N-acetyltransferase [Clostridia bacterium]QTE70106.1 GNAT family N-acetyltransferase [Clostridiales bacterium FE2011]
MIKCYQPALEDLGFRESLLADPDTMSYNNAWGGTIPFPREKWESWYQYWIGNPEGKRFYRYLQDEETGEFVGEIAWHLDEKRNIHICDVIILARYRNRGYGSEGIRLLCEAAKRSGIAILYDDIAADNPSWKLFLKNGFEISSRDDEVVMVRKVL